MENNKISQSKYKTIANRNIIIVYLFFSIILAFVHFNFIKPRYEFFSNINISSDTIQKIVANYKQDGNNFFDLANINKDFPYYILINNEISELRINNYKKISDIKVSRDSFRFISSEKGFNKDNEDIAILFKQINKSLADRIIYRLEENKKNYIKYLTDTYNFISKKLDNSIEDNSFVLEKSCLTESILFNKDDNKNNFNRCNFFDTISQPENLILSRETKTFLKKKINSEINISTDLKLNALSKDILIFKNNDLLSMNKNLTQIRDKKPSLLFMILCYSFFGLIFSLIHIKFKKIKKIFF
jgi:hypothetical protein